MLAIVITVATPMTTPSIVSPERSLFARRLSNAMMTFSSNVVYRSRRVRNMALLFPHGVDGIEHRRTPRRIHAEDHADPRPQQQRHRHRPAGDARRERGE